MTTEEYPNTTDIDYGCFWGIGSFKKNFRKY